MTDRKLKFERLTKHLAGCLSEDEASKMIGPWWQENTGFELLKSQEGKETLHRVWLRYTFNDDPNSIPEEVLVSHALEKPHYLAHCWFARALWERKTGVL